ncbi:MAG: flagellar hook-basal body complex protein FliE [Bdellovibrionota bacterium]
MDGFTVSNSSKFLKSGFSTEGQSLRVDKPSMNNNGLTGTDSTSETGAKSFADTLKDAVGEVNQLQKTSDKKMQDLTTGRTDNVADVMVAAEKADIALRVMVQVRNKIIDAYNEIMKMQV